MDIDLYYTEYLSDDYGHLVFTTVSGSKSNVEITYRLTCPYVFNDNKTHEIVAYCKGKKNYKCYRLTFDGKDIPVEMADGHSDVATGTIVLE